MFEKSNDLHIFLLSWDFPPHFSAASTANLSAVSPQAMKIQFSA